MKNKEVVVSIIVAVIALFFVGNSITGYSVKNVSYEDLCRADADCSDGKVCCAIYDGYGLCDYNDYCQSIEFLCRGDAECEPGTVCCISEGMEYGICNQEDKCMSIGLFSVYISEVKAKVDSEKLSPKSTGVATLIIIALVAIIGWLLWKNKKNR
jgi:hypothetical protein